MPKDRPNFLILVVDEMQSACIGANGNPDVRTPNLDRLAEAGVSFRRAYVNNPVCSPSRATLFTGLTPRQHGLVTNGMPLPCGVPTITQALVDAGYRTHAVGKLHVQPFNAHLADPGPDGPIHSWEDRTLWDCGRITHLPLPYYGFQTVDFVGGHVSYCFGDYVNWLNAEHPGLRDRYRMETSRVLGRQLGAWAIDLPPELHYNHWIADRTMAFLDGLGPDENFFLWCSFADPHPPFAACGPYSDLYDPASVALSPTADLDRDPLDLLADHRRVFPWLAFDEQALRVAVAQTYGMITHLDDNVGRVLDRLQTAGLADNTVVVFVADHGEYLGTHHLAGKSIWPYEELLRTPFIWTTPSGMPRPTGCDDVVSLLDFAPSVLEYAGVDARELGKGTPAERVDRGLPGRSLRPLLDHGTPLPDRPALVEYDEDRGDGPFHRCRTLVDTRYKLTLFGGPSDGLLFHLVNDPDERHNLYDDPRHRDDRDRLVGALLERLTETDRLGAKRMGSA